MLLSKLSLLSFIAGSHLAGAALRKNQDSSSSSSRRLNFRSCTVLKSEISYEDHHTEEKCSCETDDGTIAELTNLDQGSCKGMKSAVSVLSSSDGFYFDTRTQKASIPMGAELESIDVEEPSRRRRLATVGAKSILIIRADAPDSSTTANPSTLREEVAGVGGNDPVNLSSQYSACSYGQLTFSLNTQYGNQGVHEVTITTSVTGVDDGIIKNAMRDQSEIDLEVSDLKLTADYVLLCIPPGTSGGWIAYAYVNHWLSVYNNNWCTYPSGLMHEVGHNLGLAHSGVEGQSEYADSSGLMGVSYGSDDTPLMCFNGAKTYQLDWFPTFTQDVTADTSFSWSGDLIGFTDKNRAQSNDKMIFRLIPKNNDEYYVHFNLAAGFNEGTNKAKSKVLITTRPRGLDYEKSNIQEVLEANESYTIQNFGDSGALIITVGSITLNSNSKSWVDLTIQYGSGGVSPTPPPVSAPTPPPVSEPTPPPVSEPTPPPVSAPSQPPAPTSVIECTDDHPRFDCTTSTQLDNRCNNSERWTDNNYCQLSCFNAGNGYDGDNCSQGPNPDPTMSPVAPTSSPTVSPTLAPSVPPTPAPNPESCTNCSDNPPRTKECGSLNLSNKCNAKRKWRNNNYCEYSCYLEGLGYDGVTCCAR